MMMPRRKTYAELKADHDRFVEEYRRLVALWEASRRGESD